MDGCGAVHRFGRMKSAGLATCFRLVGDVAVVVQVRCSRRCCPRGKKESHLSRPAANESASSHRFVRSLASGNGNPHLPATTVHC